MPRIRTLRDIRTMSTIWREQRTGVVSPKVGRRVVPTTNTFDSLKLTSAGVAEQNIRVIQSDIIELLAMSTEDLPGAAEMLSKLQDKLNDLITTNEG